MVYLENQIQHFKDKAYYKVSNDQCYTNNRKENVEILEELMEDEHGDWRKKIYFLEEELAETSKKSADTVADTIYNEH